MRLLLDTHAFLWWIFDNPKLPLSARARITDPTADVFFSTVSAWEIAIKARMGRLEMLADVPAFLVEQVRRNGLQVLPVEVHRLPEWKDPGGGREPLSYEQILEAGHTPPDVIAAFQALNEAARSLDSARAVGA